MKQELADLAILLKRSPAPFLKDSTRKSIFFISVPGTISLVAQVGLRKPRSLASRGMASARGTRRIGTHRGAKVAPTWFRFKSWDLAFVGRRRVESSHKGCS